MNKVLVLLLIIVMACIILYKDNSYIPEFSDEMNKIICIEEGI